MESMARLYPSTRRPPTLWGSRRYRRDGHLLVTPTQGLMRDIASVEDVVLEHEEYIKSHGEESETELCGISEQRAPVIIVVSDQEHLEHAQCSSCEVEEDVPDTPTNGTFSEEVHESLWYVLDEGDPQLHVGAVEEEVQPYDD